MAQQKTGLSPTIAGFTRNQRILIAVVIVVAIAMFLLRLASGGAGRPFFGDTDDAMRMVVVRDFLAGQGWYDHIQHRLNTPFGAEIHWSRLVDAPIAALVLIANLFAGANGEHVAGTVWPLALLAVTMWLSARLALRLVGPQGILPALVLPVLSPAIINEFAPGRIDHHNVQIVLTLAIAWASVEALKRPRFALLAGLAAATSLAIGTEGLPSVCAAILVFGLIWVMSPERLAAVRGFAAAFAGAALVHLAIALPPERWLEPACDALSLVYVSAALLVSVVFIGLTLLPVAHRSTAWRLVVGIVAGGLACGALLAVFPDCLGGPYSAVDPWLTANWLNRIAEAKPWWESVGQLPAYTIAVGVAPMLAIFVIAYRCWSDPRERGEWLILGVFVVAVTLVMLLQVRGARLAIMPAIPAAAWLIVAVRERFVARPKLGWALVLVGSWLAFSGIVMLMAINAIVQVLPVNARPPIATRGSTIACLAPTAFDGLRTMAPQRVMAPIDLGSHLLLETAHSVVSAPYHRDQQGVRATFDFLNLPIEQARRIINRRGISLVVICPAMPEMAGMANTAPDSFIKLLDRNSLPDWLTEIAGDGPLRVFRVGVP